MNLQFERLSFRFGWPSRIALLVCVLIFVVAYFPIRWLSATVAKTTSCQVAVLQPEGTLWKAVLSLDFQRFKRALQRRVAAPR